jgi:hypothetical protein
LFDPNSGVEQVDLVAAIREVDGWNAVISTVFLGTPPVVWTSLDLSSAVGEQVGLVLLRVAISPSFEPDNQYFAFKSNADATLDYLPSSSTGVCVSAGYANFGSVFYILIETDATGIVQWIGSPEQTVQIDLFGYVDAVVIPDLYIASVTPAALSMRVTFSGPVVNDTELRNPSNYTFTPSLSTNGGIECISVTPQARVDYPTYVDLEITDCTNSAEYTLAITAHRIQNQGGDFIESDGNTIIYNGVSNPPSILLAVSTSETTYRVVFSKMMAVNADLVNPSKYVFSDGLKCLSVAVENTSSVILTTTKQILGHVYSLTVG